MNSNLEIALQLLITGMVTVFLILFLVVFIGNMIIRFVNKYIPETENTKQGSVRSNNEVDATKMAVISSTVQLVTGGKGKVVKVEKL